MDEYGYLYNKFNKDVKKFSTIPVLHLKSNNDNHSLYAFIVCILLLVIILKY